MFYKAIITDNSDFFKTGKVKVRLAKFYTAGMVWDLSSNEKALETFKEFGSDFEAELFSPLGGGRNYGILFVPQINEKGIVFFLGRGFNKPIWMGSLFEAGRDEDNKINHINIPSDLSEAEGEDSDGSIKKEFNMDAEDESEALEKNIVIRTKNTTYKNEDIKELDWQEQRTSNIISIGKKNIKIRHFNDEDGWDETTPQKWQDITINKDEDEKDQILFTIQNDVDNKKSNIKIIDEKISFEIDNDGDINSFICDENGFSFIDKNENELNSTDTGWTLEMKDGSIIEMKNDGDITIEAKSGNLILKGNTDINLNGDDDTAVKYSKLKNIIEKFEEHVHITQGPAGPTSGAMNGPAGAPPIGSIITSDKLNMESKNVKVK